MQDLPSVTIALKDTPLIELIPVNLVLQIVPNATLPGKTNVILGAAYKATVAHSVYNVVKDVVIVLNNRIHANNVSQDSIR